MKDFDAMIAGYRRFRQHGWAEQRQRWSDLAEGQHPGVMVIACSDSRVDPAIVFDARPGEMFVVRNVGALVPPFAPDNNYHGVSSALEFGVAQLEVSDLVVMGHGFCGGCSAALTGQFDQAGSGQGHFIHHWVEMLAAARDKVRAAHPVLDRPAFEAMELEGVRVSLANLRTFPWIAERERAGALRLHGTFFAVADGVLRVLDEASDTFSPA